MHDSMARAPRRSNRAARGQAETRRRRPFGTPSSGGEKMRRGAPRVSLRNFPSPPRPPPPRVNGPSATVTQATNRDRQMVRSDYSISGHASQEITAGGPSSAARSGGNAQELRELLAAEAQR